VDPKCPELRPADDDWGSGDSEAYVPLLKQTLHTSATSSRMNEGAAPAEPSHIRHAAAGSESAGPADGPLGGPLGSAGGTSRGPPGAERNRQAADAGACDGNNDRMEAGQKLAEVLKRPRTDSRPGVGGEKRRRASHGSAGRPQRPPSGRQEAQGRRPAAASPPASLSRRAEHVDKATSPGKPAVERSSDLNPGKEESRAAYAKPGREVLSGRHNCRETRQTAIAERLKVNGHTPDTDAICSSRCNEASLQGKQAMRQGRVMNSGDLVGRGKQDGQPAATTAKGQTLEEIKAAALLWKQQRDRLQRGAADAPAAPLRNGAAADAAVSGAAGARAARGGHCQGSTHGATPDKAAAGLGTGHGRARAGAAELHHPGSTAQEPVSSSSKAAFPLAPGARVGGRGAAPKLATHRGVFARLGLPQLTAPGQKGRDGTRAQLPGALSHAANVRRRHGL
jgi:hypothetical protein